MANVDLPRLSLDELNDRIVPATLLDLTTADAEATAAEAIVRQVDAQPTGTGYIRSFVRLQGAAAGGGGEQGYNTTARPLQFDENSSPQFTRELRASQVPLVVEGGVAYREFLLDINQKSSAGKLSLDEVRVFFATSSDLTGYDAAAKTLGGHAAAFDLDAAGDVSVVLNAKLNSGSGSGDMKLLVPDAAFAAAGADDYVYLYSKLGGVAGATANGGFEEWAVRTDGGTNTTLGTASIAGSVWLDQNRDGVRDAIDGGLANVTITLQGVDDLGRTVVLTTTTAEDGSYSFKNLRAGTYSLIQTQPEGLEDGQDFIGSLGGYLADIDKIADIHIANGAAGVYYDFSEYLYEGGSNT
jgi:hypothetical protein